MSYTSNPKARARTDRKKFTLRDLRQSTGSRTTRRNGFKADWRNRCKGLATVETPKEALRVKRRKWEAEGRRLV